jgi:hypothetical protein
MTQSQTPLPRLRSFACHRLWLIANWSVDRCIQQVVLIDTVLPTLPQPTRPSMPTSSPFFTVKLIPSSVGWTASLFHENSPSSMDNTYEKLLVRSLYRMMKRAEPRHQSGGSPSARVCEHLAAIRPPPDIRIVD